MCYNIREIIDQEIDLFQKRFYQNSEPGPGEEICSICSGSGIAYLIDDLDNNVIHGYRCPKCKGDGFVGWIENIFFDLRWNPSGCTGSVDSMTFLTKKKFEEIKKRLK